MTTKERNEKVRGILKDVERKTNRIIEILRDTVNRDCIIWVCLSAFGGGKLDELLHFVENNHVTDDILYNWDEMNIPRKRNLYEYEKGVEYEFLMETEEETD